MNDQNAGTEVDSAFWVTELDSGRIVGANEAAFRLLGTDRASAMGKSTVELGLWADEGHRNSFLACLSIGGRFVRYPVRLVPKSGRSLEFYLSGEPFDSDGTRLLLTRTFREPFPHSDRPDVRQDEIVRFLARTATKFLIDEGADFFRLVAEELRSLVPHSIVAACVYDPVSSGLVVNTYAGPEDLRPNLADQLGLVVIGDQARAALLNGELFQVPTGGASVAGMPCSAEKVRAVLRSLDVASHFLIGLTWNGTVYGAVSLLIREPDDPPDRSVVEAFVRQASVALQRNERSRALRESLNEKETLLREIHHRVKNNLQIVASLLKLQGGATRDPATLTVLGEAADRVQSMALVHTMLYGNRNLASVDAAEFLRLLTAQIVRGGRFAASGVRIEFDLQSIRLDPDHAVPIGLIVNELVTNALKYGMPGAKDFRIRVAFRQDGEGRELVVADSAGALPADFKPESIHTLGMQLVSNLTRQLRGRFSFTAGGETVFRVCFPTKEF